MSLDRRDFLKAGALLGVGALAGPRLLFGATWLPPADVVVIVFLRGGADALQMVVPHGDPDYRRLRPTIGVPSPGQSAGALDLDGFFGLHPSLAPLLPIYRDGRLGIVHATGLKHDERSHFACQDHIETGIHGVAVGGHAGHSGWGNRWMVADGASGGFVGVGMGNSVPMALRGDAGTLAMTSLAGFAFASTSARKPALEQALVALHGRGSALCLAGRAALDNARYLAQAAPTLRPVEHGAVYPSGAFGNQLKEVAQLVKSGLGLRVACVDLGGFDHHDAIQAELPPLLATLSSGLAAFHQDLGARMDEVTLVTMSEFGRRAGENASGGTDHGCGSMMLLLGGGVRGGRVISNWPGLQDARLFNGDLDVTIDYRSVLAELMMLRMGGRELDSVFPDVAGLPQPGCFRPTRLTPDVRMRVPTPQPVEAL